MIYHSIVINVKDKTTSCSIDIIQGEGNDHQLIIKLVDGSNFYNISGYRPEISFYDPSEDRSVLTEAVNVINAYRGYMSYIVGSRILRNPGRYTVTLCLNPNNYNPSYDCNCECHNLTKFNFIINVLKDTTGSTSCCPCHDQEVVITREFYERLKCHLNDQIKHLSNSDRATLLWLSDNYDTIVTVGSGDNNIFEILKSSEEFQNIVIDCLENNPELINSITDKVKELIQEDLTKLRDDIDQNTLSIEDLRKKLYLQGQDVADALRDAGSAMNTANQALEITKQYDQRIDDLVTDISTLGSRVTQAEENASNALSKSESVESEVSQYDSRITQAENKAEEASTIVQTYDTRLGVIETKVEGIETTFSEWKDL